MKKKININELYNYFNLNGCNALTLIEYMEKKGIAINKNNFILIADSLTYLDENNVNCKYYRFVKHFAERNFKPNFANGSETYIENNYIKELTTNTSKLINGLMVTVTKEMKTDIFDKYLDEKKYPKNDYVLEALTSRYFKVFEGYINLMNEKCIATTEEVKHSIAKKLIEEKIEFNEEVVNDMIKNVLSTNSTKTRKK